jgi:hypothetical protein
MVVVTDLDEDRAKSLPFRQILESFYGIIKENTESMAPQNLVSSDPRKSTNATSSFLHPV